MGIPDHEDEEWEDQGASLVTSRLQKRLLCCTGRPEDEHLARREPALEKVERHRGYVRDFFKQNTMHCLPRFTYATLALGDRAGCTGHYPCTHRRHHRRACCENGTRVTCAIQ